MISMKSDAHTKNEANPSVWPARARDDVQNRKGAAAVVMR